MDAYEATRIVFSRIQALDPENAAKIMGLLLIQDHGEKEMIRLAFGPETLLHSVILKGRKDLQGQQPQMSRGGGPNSPSSWAPPLPFSRTTNSVAEDCGVVDADDYHLSFLNEQTAGGDPPYGIGGVWDQRTCLSPDGFGWKPCLYFARGFCKNGSSCRFLHGPADDISAAAPTAVEQQCQELMLMRSKSQRLTASSVAAATAFPYSPTGNSIGKCLNFMLQQQQNENRRAASAAAVALMLENENHKFMGRPRMDRSDFAGMVNPGSRQIYLTFPADSTFREEDVSNYFSIYGPVQDVRIPYQQKRMFGFVTFVYPETVKLILAKGNPHFVCDARVLVKPYKEKGKVPDKKQQQQAERIDFSVCTTPTGLDSRDPFDLQQLATSRMLYVGTNQDVLLRRKMEEQQAAAELQQAIEMQGRRFMGLQILDIKNRTLTPSTAPILSPLATPSSGTFNSAVLSNVGRSSNGSQDEALAVEDKRLSSASASGTASAAALSNAPAADKQQSAVNSGRATAEPSPNEDINYHESAEHNLPDSPFASPTKSSFVNDSFSLANEESSLTCNGSSISNSNDHFIASTLLSPSSPLENMDSLKSSCFFQMPRFSSGHGAVGL